MPTNLDRFLFWQPFKERFWPILLWKVRLFSKKFQRQKYCVSAVTPQCTMPFYFNSMKIQTYHVRWPLGWQTSFFDFLRLLLVFQLNLTEKGKMKQSSLTSWEGLILKGWELFSYWSISKKRRKTNPKRRRMAFVFLRLLVFVFLRFCSYFNIKKNSRPFKMVPSHNVSEECFPLPPYNKFN